MFIVRENSSKNTTIPIRTLVLKSLNTREIARSSSKQSGAGGSPILLGCHVKNQPCDKKFLIPAVTYISVNLKPYCNEICGLSLRLPLRLLVPHMHFSCTRLWNIEFPSLNLLEGLMFQISMSYTIQTITLRVKFHRLMNAPVAADYGICILITT